MPDASAPAIRVHRAAPDDLAGVLAVADAASEQDGADPFNEQTRLDLASGRRSAHAAYSGADGSTGPDADRIVGAAATGAGELDLVVLPGERGRGYGTALLESLLPTLDPNVSAWSHGDHPAARALAASHGFQLVRTLLRLRLPSLIQVVRRPLPDGIRIETFDPVAGASDWLAVNSRAFAGHPEQGRMSADDLSEREAEPWFDPDDFLVALDDEGRMLGFHWMKLEPGSDEGEVYVLGVDPGAAGRGLGSVLLAEGLVRMRERGRTSASLYVEGDNDRALALYRRAGFVDDAVDVQFRRAPA
ncbi:mycothiol synthase [Humibacter sp.]|jgi:mycothiol synthase|uniref:mycothiol synthase n=1 Tax=Humibacter sp. TaxID=1940291 RepID=UPI002C783E6E|nr:mycothiol synthase [Humibacter sp.]HVX09072.1 mycothiol synthase [Humibacter sp.]